MGDTDSTSTEDQPPPSSPIPGSATWKWLLPLLLLAAVAVTAWYFLREDGPLDDAQQFQILTGSENRILFDDPNSDEPTIMERFEEEHDVDFVPSYQGSVDTMLDIQAGADPYDAVWPASSIWLNLGNTDGVVSDIESIMGSPVVFGVKRSKAEELGWIGADVTVADILAAVESDTITFMMSSATQSNSGAMAYLGYLYAFAGQPDVLTSEHLQDPAVAEQTRRILGEVDRTAGSSGFLRDLFLEQYAAYDAMVNNESAIITANQALTEQGETDLLYVIYPIDGLALADWPLGYVDRNDTEKDEIFDALQAYLLSPEVQQELLDQGRRTNPFTYEMTEERIDPGIFNPDWGIDIKRVIDPIVVPSGPVLHEALTLYQSAFRKPSFTILLLDYSGSMKGDGKEDMTEAMRVMLDQEEAATYFLQRTGDDITIVIPFTDAVGDQWRVEGNDNSELTNLWEQIAKKEVGGGTDIYLPIIAALDEMEGAIDGYAPAIILLTDGRSKDDNVEAMEERWLAGSPDGIPVYSILFGDADDDQLEKIAELTSGDVYDGRDGLIDALRASFANS